MAEQIKLDTFLSEGKGEDKRIDVKGPYELPEDWKWIRLGEVVLRAQYGISKAMNTEKIGVPVIRMGNITYDGQLDLTHLKYIDMDEKTADKYILNKGDILFNRTNSKELVGKTAIFNLDGKYAFVSYLIRVIVNRNKVLPEYVWAFLNSKRGKAILFKMARPAVQMANINAKELCSIKIPLPPLEEQKHIVARIEELISRAGEAMKLRRIASEEAEKIMQAALHKVFGRAEEKGWEWTRLEEVAHINKETRNPSVEMPDETFSYIDISGIEGGTGRIIEVKKILGKNAPSRARRVVHTNDVIMSTVRPYLKSFAIIPERFDNQICSTGFAVLSCRGSTLPKYLLYALFSEVVIRQCNEMMMGAHYPALRTTQVSQIKIPLPPLEERKRMVAYLDGIRETVESVKKLQQETEGELEKMVPAILERAFKGEL